MLPPHRCLVSMNFLFQGYWNNSSACKTVSYKQQGLVPSCTYISHTYSIFHWLRGVWFMFSQSLEINVKTCGNYLQEFLCYSPSKQWQVFHHCRTEDGWAVSAFPCPGSSSWAGKWLKKAGATLSRPAPFTGSNSQMPGRCQRPCSQWQRGQ